MNALSNIRRYFAQKRLKETLLKSNRLGYVDTRKLKSLILIINTDTFDVGDELAAFLQELKRAFSSLQNIRVVGLSQKKKNKLNEHQLKFKNLPETTLLLKNEFSFFYRLKKDELRKNLEKKPVYMLLVFDREQNFAVKRLVASISSEFNVGYQNDENIELFDLMMKSELNTLAFGKEIIRYIKLIDDKS